MVFVLFVLFEHQLVLPFEAIRALLESLVVGQ